MAILTSVCLSWDGNSPPSVGSASPPICWVGPSELRGRDCPGLCLRLHHLSCCLRWPLSCRDPVFTVGVRVCACFDAGTTLS